MNNKRFAAALLIAALFAAMSFSNLFSQDMQPPKPVENKTFDAMVGDWSGEMQSMGMTYKTDFSVRWALNHQFIIIDLKGENKDNANMKYSGHGIYGFDDKGSIKSWWFDDWGFYGTSTGSGTVSGSKFDVSSANDFYSETRSFDVNGNDAKMNAKGTYVMNGQKVPFEETGTYHRK